jgi:hypothetical protein
MNCPYEINSYSFLKIKYANVVALFIEPLPVILMVFSVSK